MRNALVVPAASAVAGIVYLAWQKYSMENLERTPWRWPWQHQVVTVGVIGSAMTAAYFLIGD
jgi:hypothetical protein